MSSDGVEFIIEVKDQAGAITKKFSRYIDPKHNAGERHWLNGQIDLSGYRNQTIELLFSTTPGPKGDTTYDWAAWSNLHFQGTARPLSEQPFQPIYTAEANIYRYDGALPRAAIYHHAELAPSPGEALRTFASPSLDVFRGIRQFRTRRSTRSGGEEHQSAGAKRRRKPDRSPLTLRRMFKLRPRCKEAGFWC